MNSKPRLSNIELLRVVAAVLVLLLHANYISIGRPTYLDMELAPLSTSLRVFWESISLYAVDLFVLISGWFSIRWNMKSLAGFVFQSLFISISVYSVFALTGHLHSFPLKAILYVKDGCWFVPAYLMLYLLSPVLNGFVDNVSKTNFGRILIALYIYVLVWGWYGDDTTIRQGYSVLSFIVLYLTSRYVRLYVEGSKDRLSNWILVFVLSVLFNTLFGLVAVKYERIYYLYISYINPLTILSAISLLKIFSKIDIGYKPFVNYIAMSSLSVYLFTSLNITFPYYKECMRICYFGNNSFMAMAVILFSIAYPS